MRASQIIHILGAVLLLTTWTKGASAQPDLVVRMGQLTLPNNDAPAAIAGTLHQNIVPGETRTINLLLENRGDSNLTIDSAVPIEGSGASLFSISFGPDTLIEPGQGAFLILSYAPTEVGVHLATMRLATNDPEDAQFFVNFRGETTEIRAGAPPVDISILGYSATSKCNLKKGICTAKGKADTINLSAAPGAGFTWFFTPSEDGLFSQSTPFLASGFTKNIKGYKGFPATLPRKKAKFKATTPTPGAQRFVLFLLPAEGDLDYSDNSIEVTFPLF